MLDPCPKINDRNCYFSINSVHCGQGKGESLIKDVISCDGKHPKYDAKFLKGLKNEKKTRKITDH